MSLPKEREKGKSTFWGRDSCLRKFCGIHVLGDLSYGVGFRQIRRVARPMPYPILLLYLKSMPLLCR
ncbi:MAG: hypothetical protein MI923_22090 [Phycisphaerales bacterium]|nr:hypothetical protein [Phycisphaerales bacterium]